MVPVAYYIKFWKICTHRNVLYLQCFYLNTFTIFKYDDTQEFETTSNAPQHITQNEVNFKVGFCVIRDFIVTMQNGQPQLYLFSLEGDFVKSETMPILQEKNILNSYNEDSMLARDNVKKELWVVKVNGEATQISIDAQKPWRACVAGKTLFVYCYEKKAIIKYVLT